MQNTYFDDIFSNANDRFLPGISIDCVILGFDDGELKILLNNFSGYPLWMLPGGFVYRNENVGDAAYRLLNSRTGLNKIYLKQFYTFGDCKRTKMDENEQLINCLGYNQFKKGEKHWLLQRFISIGYYAFVEYNKVKINSESRDQTAWFSIDQIPKLYSDHNEIINKTLSSIRSQLGSVPVGYELLPEKFTLTELRLIYEAILNKKLDRRNFQRKIFSSGLIIKLDEMSRKWGVKPSTLYMFDKKKYKEAMKNGILFSV